MKRITLLLAALVASITSLRAQQTTDFSGSVPAKFTVELDFSSGNPFAAKLTARDSQSEEGEAYEFPFRQGKNSASLFFTLCKGPNGNTYSINRKSGNLDFMRPESKPDNRGYFKIPAVPGRYVKMVEITVATKNTRILFCRDAAKAAKGKGFISSLEIEEPGTGYADFTSEQAGIGEPVYLYRAGSGAFRFSNLKITYASDKSKGKKK